MAANTESIDDLTARYGPAYRTLVMVAAMLASCTMVVSATIVNVAIPDVMGTFGVGQEQAQLMATAYNVAMTTSQLLYAWLAGFMGRRAVYVLTLAAFALGSFIAALAGDFGVVVFGRALQGAAAGVMAPLAMVTIYQIFPVRRRGFAMGLYSMGMTLSVSLGPPIGGLVMEFFDWRYVFYVSLPLIGVAFILGIIFMPTARSDRQRPFDWSGYICLVIAMYCFVSGLTEGMREGWSSDYIVGMFVVSLVTGVLFIIRQFQSEDALVDFSVFRYRQFTNALIITFVFGLGNYASSYGIPLFGQLVQKLSPIDAGLIVMPAAILGMLILPFTAPLTDTVPPRIAIIFGLFMFAASAAMMALADINTVYIHLVIFTMISRFGMNFIIPFIMHTALESLPAHKLDNGGGVLNFFRQLGGSTGLAAWAVFVQTRTQFHSDALAVTQNSGNAASREYLEGIGQILNEVGVPRAEQHSSALHYLGQVVYEQATTLAFQDGFWVLVVAFVLAIIPAWTLRRRNIR